MSKHQLALLLVVPLILLALSIYARVYENRILTLPVEKLEAVRYLKELALDPSQERNPYVKIKQLSEILINVDAASNQMVKGVFQFHRGLFSVLVGCAFLQIGISIYVFRRLKVRHREPNPLG